METPLQQDRFVKNFFKSLTRSKPTKVRACPSWDLSLVLRALTNKPFEPLEESSLKHVTLKTAFLVAIASARRVSDLQALSIREPFPTVFDDRIILRTDPSFLPKVASTFHRTQDIILPTLFSSSDDDEGEFLSLLDVKRNILFYLEITKEFRLCDSLFVNFSGARKGHRTSKSSIARWLRMLIVEAYQIGGREPPIVKAHFTRAVAVSWAESRSLPGGDL